MYAIEHLIEGDYVKHNNNSGYVSAGGAGQQAESAEALRHTPHAFSHFTYEFTGGRALCVDIQVRAAGGLLPRGRPRCRRVCSRMRVACVHMCGPARHPHKHPQTTRDTHRASQTFILIHRFTLSTAPSTAKPISGCAASLCSFARTSATRSAARSG